MSKVHKIDREVETVFVEELVGSHLQYFYPENGQSKKIWSGPKLWQCGLAQLWELVTNKPGQNTGPPWGRMPSRKMTEQSRHDSNHDNRPCNIAISDR